MKNNRPKDALCKVKLLVEVQVPSSSSPKNYVLDFVPLILKDVHLNVTLNWKWKLLKK